jgi:hypothetical protein
MQKTIRTLKILAVAVVAAVGLGVVAAPAEAVTTCPTSNYLCMWTSPNYTGSRTTTDQHVCQNIIAPWDNNITSLKVSATPSSNGWRLYKSYNCAGGVGTFLTVSAGTNISQLAATWDNDFSSIGPACPQCKQ